jgi:hypothetical protein
VSFPKILNPPGLLDINQFPLHLLSMLGSKLRCLFNFIPNISFRPRFAANYCSESMNIVEGQMRHVELAHGSCRAI